MYRSKGCRFFLWSQVASMAIFATTLAQAQPRTQCNDEVQVQQGENLSDLAERCGIAEARILDLNPNIEGSRDLRPGMTVNLAAPTAKDAAARANDAAASLFGRLKSYAKAAEESIEQAAETATQSVQDFLARNPDLNHRVRKFGQSLNIPGMDKVEAQVSLSVRKGSAGTPVTLSAIGLPPNQRVEIAGGARASEYQIMESARTSAEGTLQVTVQLPHWADPHSDFIFVIAIPASDLALRSAAFDVL